MSDYTYAGGELGVFEKAVRWKAYWRSRLARYVRGAVLEVGAGIGANTAALADLEYDCWVCLEPDRSLAARIVPPAGGRHRVLAGTTNDLSAGDSFDTVLYLDVIEHIEDDRAELGRAAAHMSPGGSLIVLAPALGFLFGPFDRAIGHYRRYTKRALRTIAPPGLCEREMGYLDSAGLVVSAGNRFILRSSMPREAQILFWDRVLVPCSVWLDQMLLGAVGRSILAVWAAEGSPC